MNWLSNNNIKFKIIFTKEDKLKLNQKNENASKYINEVFQKLKIYPEFVVSSSKTKKGRNEISNLILSEI